jgi:hypothetical protein
LQFLALTVEDDKHNDNIDNIHSQPNDHEGTLVAGEKTGCGAEPEDGEHIGDVVKTAGDHCCGGGATADTYKVTTMPDGSDWDKQPETQNGIKRRLDAKANNDG